MEFVLLFQRGFLLGAFRWDTFCPAFGSRIQPGTLRLAKSGSLRQDCQADLRKDFVSKVTELQSLVARSVPCKRIGWELSEPEVGELGKVGFYHQTYFRKH